MSFLASEGACRHTKIFNLFKGEVGWEWGGSVQALLTTVGGQVGEVGWSQKKKKKGKNKRCALSKTNLIFCK